MNNPSFPLPPSQSTGVSRKLLVILGILWALTAAGVIYFCTR